MPKRIVLIGTPSLSARIHCDCARSGPVQETGSKTVFCGASTYSLARVFAARLAGVDDAQVPIVIADRSARAAEAELLDRRRRVDDRTIPGG